MGTSRKSRFAFALTASIGALFAGGAHRATAQEATPPKASPAPAPKEDVIIITGTRREVNVQDVPLNIAAVSGSEIKQQGAGNMSELSSSIAGLHIVDTGGHASNQIIVRGLNADPLSANDGQLDSGGTVAEYVGEIPLHVDLRLNDIDRVEVLMGPQGTLYGSGSLGGAIRYIPMKPQLGAQSISYRTDFYGYNHAQGISSDVGSTFNIPVGGKLALRGSIDRLADKGFIDYNYVTRDAGVTDPDPDFTNPADVAANLFSLKDANTKDVLSGRLAARFKPVNWWDTTLTYYYQDGFLGGRQISSKHSTLATPDYVSAKRVPEYFERSTDLLALETQFDLGFADLTYSAGFSRLFEKSHRDQSDLLILLNPANTYYYYDNFPTFTAYTQDGNTEKILTQELRAVSKSDGPFSWIGGAFYSYRRTDGYSKEITPHLSQYLFDNYFFAGTGPRPDDLEYYNVGFERLAEYGLYGELGWDITKKWNVTFGDRFYKYNLETLSATDFPLLNTQLGGEGPTDITLDFSPANQKKHGFLWKLNSSYKFTDDFMGYLTRSAGFRVGNSNGLDICDGSATQTVCATGSEAGYDPDETINYEVGVHSQWFQRALTLNLATFYVDWKKPQVSSATLVGAQPITINGTGAKSTGFEVNFHARPTNNFRLRGSFGFSKAVLTSDSPDLITVSNVANGYLVPNVSPVAQGSYPYGPGVTPPACTYPGLSGLVVGDTSSPFGGQCIGNPQANYRVDGIKGDRLPGSPEYQFSLFGTYEVPMESGLKWEFNYGIHGIGDVLSRTGARGGSYTLPSYILHDASAGLSASRWTMTLYVKNLFDKFAETGAAGTALNNAVFLDDDGGQVHSRSFTTDVLPPRQIGLRMDYKFGEGR